MGLASITDQPPIIAGQALQTYGVTRAASGHGMTDACDD